MISLMSDCLLRISEVVSVNVGDIKGSVLHLKASKTDQEGKGEALYICEFTRRVIKRYLRKAEIERGALFRRVRFRQHLGKGRLSTKGVREAIKRWAAEAGVEGFISGHSLRVGSAVSLAQAGASVVDMQTAGRWADSKIPAHYAWAKLAQGDGGSLRRGEVKSCDNPDFCSKSGKCRNMAEWQRKNAQNRPVCDFNRAASTRTLGYSHTLEF